MRPEIRVLDQSAMMFGDVKLKRASELFPGILRLRSSGMAGRFDGRMVA